MGNQIIGDKGLSCPWCGKPFIIKKEKGRVTVICSYSYCLIVPSGTFKSIKDAKEALRDRL